MDAKTIVVYLCTDNQVKNIVITTSIKNNIAIPLGDRGGTVVKMLCYKSDGRWFDPSWCHWYFSFT